MKTIAGSALVLGTTAWMASAAAGQTPVGALAIDERQGDQYGWAVDYETPAAAGTRALSECAHSGETDHPFRPKPITRSGRNRSPVPAETDHPFGAEGTGPES